MPLSALTDILSASSLPVAVNAPDIDSASITLARASPKLTSPFAEALIDVAVIFKIFTWSEIDVNCASLATMLRAFKASFAYKRKIVQQQRLSH